MSCLSTIENQIIKFQRSKEKCEEMIQNCDINIKKLNKKRKACQVKLVKDELKRTYKEIKLKWGKNETDWLKMIVSKEHTMNNFEKMFAAKLKSEQKWVVLVYEPDGKTEAYYAMYVQPNSKFSNTTNGSLTSNNVNKFKKSIEDLIQDLEIIEDVDQYTWIEPGFLKENRTLFKKSHSVSLPKQIETLMSKKRSNGQEIELSEKKESFILNILSTAMINITMLVETERI